MFIGTHVQRDNMDVTIFFLTSILLMRVTKVHWTRRDMELGSAGWICVISVRQVGPNAELFQQPVNAVWEFDFCDEDMKSETTLAGLVSCRIPEMSRFHTHWHAVAEWLSLSDQFINWSSEKTSVMATLKEYSVHAIWYVSKIKL